MSLFKRIKKSFSMFYLKILGRCRFYSLLRKNGGCYSFSEVTQYLDISEVELAIMVSNQQLLYLSLSYQKYFPVWQFVDHKVLPGFETILQSLNNKAIYSQIRFFLSEDYQLGMTRIYALRSGCNIDVLIDKARNFDIHACS